MRATSVLFAVMTFAFPCATFATLEYSIRGTVQKSGSAYHCDVEVRNPPGTVILTRQITVEQESELIVRLPRGCCDGAQARVGVLVDRAEQAVAVLELRTPDGVVTTYDAILKAKPSAAGPPTIDLQVENAVLADVIPKFRKVSGRTITGLPADLLGAKVTAAMRGVPWPEALTQILEPTGLFWRYQGNRKVRIDRVDAIPHFTSKEYSTPTPRDLVRPAFPFNSRARIQGIVILESIIDENGSVAHVKILKGLPFGLDRAAVFAVRQWRWKPATKAGTPVAIRYNLTVNFDSSVVKSRDRISARSGP